jgi:hypothetical protein
MITRRWRISTVGTRVLIGAAVLVLGLTVVVAATSASGPTLTKGRVPAGAMQAGAPLDLSQFPDFVAASDQQGNIVGYVPKADLAPPGAAGALVSGVAQPGPIPVYGEDLTTLVGHMYPDKGFVALGTNPDSVPSVPMQVAPAAP